MTEITRVPLQPIARGALSKLWLGLVALVLAAGGIAYATMPPSIRFETVKAGTGPSPTADDVTVISYRGTLPDGKVFDESPQALMPVSGVVPGFTKALERMQRGGKYHVVIPAALGYGDHATGPIPANTNLTFDIQLFDFVSRAEFERQRQVIQQLQQMQGGQQAAPGGPGAGVGSGGDGVGGSAGREPVQPVVPQP